MILLIHNNNNNNETQDTATAIIEAVYKTDDHLGVLKWLGRLHRVGRRLNMAGYARCMNACGELGSPDAARQILDGMIADGMEPTLEVYNAVLKVFYSASTSPPPDGVPTDDSSRPEGKEERPAAVQVAEVAAVVAKMGMKQGLSAAAATAAPTTAAGGRLVEDDTIGVSDQTKIGEGEGVKIETGSDSSRGGSIESAGSAAGGAGGAVGGGGRGTVGEVGTSAVGSSGGQGDAMGEGGERPLSPGERWANEVLRLLKDIKRASIVPDASTYVMIITVLIEAGRVDKALLLWQAVSAVQ